LAALVNRAGSGAIAGHAVHAARGTDVISSLHIQLLGGFQISADATPLPILGQRRFQELLAYLLLHHAAPQSRAHLAFVIWPDSSDAQAQSNLRTLLVRLRRALPDADRFVSVDAQTLQWRRDAPYTLDVLEFERSLAAAAAAEQRGDLPTARYALEAAINWYHGDLLPGSYDDWLLSERERLRQALIAALERLALLLEMQRDYSAAIQTAQQLLRQDPLHEATYQHLMRLHERSGDRAGALRVYRTCAMVLARELAVEPGPITRAAYDRLMQIEPPVDERQDHPGLASNRQLNNLPIALTSFVGRADERAGIAQLLSSARLLTLTGAGGSGKTRLALAVATECLANYAHGAWLVDLAALTDGRLVPQAIATVLGLREESQYPLVDTLVEALRSRHMLLLLDNCEHVITSCAGLVQTFLNACPQIQVLATSREPLGVAGEITWHVPPLAVPNPQRRYSLEELGQCEAVRLFVERAAAALPSFTLTQINAAAVAQSCRRLDGIPLAIELAAARVKILSVAQLAERLDDGLRLLAAGGRTTPPRHQSLRAAIDWSYMLLPDAERALFRRLAVFVGSWTLEAAEAISADPHLEPGAIAKAAVLELLAQLVDKSLVVVEIPTDSVARYRLLELMRQYAHEQLQASNEAALVALRHATFFLGLAETAEIELDGPQQVQWLDQIEIEHDNLHTALRWSFEHGALELALRLSGALGRFWALRGYLSEGRRWLDAALAHRSVVAAPLEAKVIYAAGMLAYRQGDYGQAETYFGDFLALQRELGHQQGVGDALAALGAVCYSRGDYAAARARYQESLTVWRALGDQLGIADALGRLGEAVMAEGDLAATRALLEESLALLQTGGNKQSIARVLGQLGEAARLQGDDDRAANYYQKSLVLVRELGYKGQIASVLHNLGHVALHQRDSSGAMARFAESLALFQKLGSKHGIASCLSGLGMVASVKGQSRQAIRLFGAALSMFDSIGATFEPADRAEFDRHMTATRQQLDDAAFQHAWAAGRAMTPEQAIAEARQIADYTAAYSTHRNPSA
jgi:predicted ATPase/DNA-binding SARP family transcriptional activator